MLQYVFKRYFLQRNITTCEYIYKSKQETVFKDVFYNQILQYISIRIQIKQKQSNKDTFHDYKQILQHMSVRYNKTKNTY